MDRMGRIRMGMTDTMDTMDTTSQLLAIHRRLSEHYGLLHWWPAESRFEVIVGAVLTQNTAWGNVEKAIANLKAAGVMEAGALRALAPEELATLIRSAGTFTVKAKRLRALLDWLGDDWPARLAGDTEAVRQALLSVSGVGEETADAILLYAAGHATFVVDAYTRRILERVGVIPEVRTYQGYRELFMGHLPADAALFNEYHAQLVQLGEDYCRKAPRCAGCPLRDGCALGSAQAAQ